MSGLQWNLLDTQMPAKVATAFNPLGSFNEGQMTGQKLQMNQLAMEKQRQDMEYNPMKLYMKQQEIQSRVDKNTVQAQKTEVDTALKEHQLSMQFSLEASQAQPGQLLPTIFSNIDKMTVALNKSPEEAAAKKQEYQKMVDTYGEDVIKQHLFDSSQGIKEKIGLMLGQGKLDQGQQSIDLRARQGNEKLKQGWANVATGQTNAATGQGNLAVNQQRANRPAGSTAINAFTTFYKGFQAEHPELQPGELDAAASDAWIQQQADLAKATGTARGEGFGAARVTNVLDTKNGNIPVPMSNLDIIKGNKEEPGRFITGTQGSKALNQTVLIEDIRGTITNTRESLAAMEDFTPEQRAQIALVLKSRDPHSAVSSFFQGSWGGTLSEPQRNYIIDLAQLHENAMAMRSVLGAGQGSDELRAAITKTIPGPGTPNKEYAKRQLDKFEETLNRLSRGVPKVPLRSVDEVAQTANVLQPTPVSAPPGWTLHEDANGNKAYVSPDGKQFQEVK